MLTLSHILIFIALVIIVYNIIPEKSKEFILLKRLKRKVPDQAGKKEPAKESLNRFVNYLEVRTKKIHFRALDEYKEDLGFKIMRSGRAATMNPDRLFALQIASSLGVLLFYLVFLYFLLEVLPFHFIWAFLSLLIGYFFPTLVWLKGEIDKRTQAILRALPDTIDLLTLCIEAGLDFNAALRKIVEKGRPGALRDEFTELEKQINMGSSRVDALRAMGRRNDINDLNSFLVALIQAVKMGTSLGPILRAQAEQLRIRRSQRAEKLAAEAPVKMLAPLIICIFPTVFIILFVPIIMQVMGMK